MPNLKDAQNEAFAKMTESIEQDLAMHDLLKIGFDKNGEIDFLASARITKLTKEQMQEFRAMIPVAISVCEQLYTMGVEERNKPVQVLGEI